MLRNITNEGLSGDRTYEIDLRNTQRQDEGKKLKKISDREVSRKRPIVSFLTGNQVRLGLKSIHWIKERGDYCCKAQS